MTFIVCYCDLYEYYKKYIELLMTDNNINLIILNNEKKFYELKDKKVLNKSINIFINSLNENNLSLLSNLKLNFCLLNTKKILLNEELFYLKNYDIKIIDYDLTNYNILKLYTNNVYYIPINIIDKFIYNYNKIYDVALIGNSSIKNTLINNFKNKNIIINDLNLFNQNNICGLLTKHKILINLNDDKDNGLLYNFFSKLCIYNKVIIINNKIELNDNNSLDKYVLDIQYDLIPYFTSYILSNYNEIYKTIFSDINNSIDNNKKSFFESIKTINLNETNKTIETIIPIISNVNQSKKNKDEYGKHEECKLEQNENEEYNKSEKIDNFGFIIIRHVNSELTNEYWIESYNCIRKYYQNKIVIIDDNSNQSFIKYDFELVNCEIINSDFPQCGELLPYYYFYLYHFFEKAIIIHDSVFINKLIDFTKYDNIKFLWHFTHDWDNEEEELDVLHLFKNNILNNFYKDKKRWMGVYGLQSVIDYSFIEKIQKKYCLFLLLKHIKTRAQRINLERIISVIFSYENIELRDEPSIFGIIHHYIHWGYTFDNYKIDKATDGEKIRNLDLVKVWSGR